MTKSLSALTFCSAFLLSSLAFAGIDLGNGGDGIILKDGKVVFYDLYERGIDADSATEQFLSNKKYNAHPTLEMSVFAVNRILDIGRKDDHNNADGAPTRAALTAVLARAGDLSPSLVSAILEQLTDIRWAPSPSTLLPNPDTQPFIDLTGVTRIGCGRNLSQTILFSPDCSRARMSPANQAAFVIHEAVYALYRKAHPTSQNSFDVRSITSALFDERVSSSADMNRLLRQSGLLTFAEKDSAIQKTFFSESAWYSLGLRCALNDPVLKSIDLNFSGALNVTGTVKTTHSDDLQSEICGSGYCFDADRDDTSIWTPGIAAFNPEQKTLVLEMGREFGDGESLTLTFFFDGSKKVIANGNGFEGSPISGQCR